MKFPERTPNVVLIILFVIALGGGAYIIYGDLREQQGRPVIDHALAIVAIVAGLVAIIYEWKLHHGFEAQRDEIQKIVLSMPTRYLGGWPDHLNDITKLVGEAKRGDELLILVDQIGYGHFSRPDDYAEYIAALEDARHKSVNVRMLLYPEDDARKSLERQFDRDHFADLASGLKAYQAYYHRLIDKVPASYDEFLTAVLFVQSSFCTRLTQVAAEEDPIEVRTINTPQAEEAFFWMIRRGSTKKDMVFAYPRFGGGKKGHAFATRDPHLLEIFSDHFDPEWADNHSTRVVPGAFLFPKAHHAMSSMKAPTNKKA